MSLCDRLRALLGGASECKKELITVKTELNETKVELVSAKAEISEAEGIVTQIEEEMKKNE